MMTRNNTIENFEIWYKERAFCTQAVLHKKSCEKVWLAAVKTTQLEKTQEAKVKKIKLEDAQRAVKLAEVLETLKELVECKGFYIGASDKDIEDEIAITTNECNGASRVRALLENEIVLMEKELSELGVDL